MCVHVRARARVRVCVCLCELVPQWRNRSACGPYTAVSSRAMPRVCVRASPYAMLNLAYEQYIPER